MGKVEKWENTVENLMNNKILQVEPQEVFES